MIDYTAISLQNTGLESGTTTISSRWSQKKKKRKKPNKTLQIEINKYIHKQNFKNVAMYLKHT